nr:lipopolysaccharide kinase InaA family protein [Sansalvadorimonas sp. 2012CJ34-2]
MRFLPGKRLVVRAQLNNRDVIAKYFFGPHALRDQQREIAGIQGFQKAGINTPELVDHSHDQNFAVVVTACLDPAISFEAIWNSNIEDSERRQWLTRIAVIIATMHKAGVEQTDIHLDNLLLHNNQLFMIDGGGAKIGSTPLQAKAALENLALFQAVLYPRFDRFLGDVWLAYSKEATEYTQQLSIEEFTDLIQIQRKWREKFIMKGLRNCTRFRVDKSWNRFVSIDREFDTEALQPLIQNPEQVISQSKIIKRGRTNTVTIVTLDNGQQVLVKRYKSKKGFLHKYLRCLTKSRARISWLNSLLLEMIGIATPRPIAMIEERFGPVVRCSYVINSFVTGQQAISWFSENHTNPDAPAVARKVTEMLENLRRSLVFHGDLKATNILLADNQPMLIDLDAMKSYKSQTKFRRAAEIDRKRFIRNWEGYPEVQQLFEPYITNKQP